MLNSLGLTILCNPVPDYNMNCEIFQCMTIYILGVHIQNLDNRAVFQHAGVLWIPPGKILIQPR
jgi:hypothetical protein